MKRELLTQVASRERTEEAELTQLELVDPTGATTGTAEKLTAHQSPGLLHRAFSVFLFDEEDRMLLQRRALGKYHSPGVWSNACCGHPLPGEPPFLAAARRTWEELGVTPTALVAADVVTYHHTDPISGLVENEYNHVFVGRVLPILRPDPDEVSDISFVTPSELKSRSAAADFSTWFPTVLKAARARISQCLPQCGDEWAEPTAQW